MNNNIENEDKIKPGNYIVLQGSTFLKLKELGIDMSANELIIYSIISNFSQINHHSFFGSINYLCEWSGCSRITVSRILKSFVERGLIICTERKGSTTLYEAVDLDTLIDNLYQNDTAEEVYQNDTCIKTNTDEGQPVSKRYGGYIKTIHDNINNTKDINNNSIDNTVKLSKKDLKEIELNNNTKDIIEFLNSTCNTDFKLSTKSTVKCIKDRFNEGFSLQDFKDVIEYKYKEWGLKPIKFTNGKLSTTYLRPITLFGNNFERYLAEAHANSHESSESSEYYKAPFSLGKVLEQF